MFTLSHRNLIQIHKASSPHCSVVKRVAKEAQGKEASKYLQ